MRPFAGWDGLDPALSRLLRFNFGALAVATVVLTSVFAAGFRHRSVVIDIVAMVVSLALMAASLPFTPRWGPRAPILGLVLSVTAFSLGATWVTPHLSPLTAMLMVVPLFVGFPYLSRAWLRALMAYAVLGSMGMAALAEYQRRNGALTEIWQVNAAVVALSLPSVTLVMLYLVHTAYATQREQADALRDSSARLVQVAADTRRGIERDLHDGAQQRLLAMSLTIERLRVSQRRGDTDEVTRLAAQLAVDNRSALMELRELARGIYPPLLTERGLVAALQAAARRTPVPVVLHTGDFPRPDPDIEAATYFCVLEAITNAVKHSGCSEVTVEVRSGRSSRSGHFLEFSVTDDGQGFDSSTVTLRGLLGTRARLTADGGRFRVVSAPGRGTTVSGRFPLAASER